MSFRRRLIRIFRVTLVALHEPGVAVAVVTSQGIAYMRTFGTCESAGDAFYIGSLSKSMCAVAIMQLVEQGKIDLDAPASDYAPEYLISPEVSVRMLLNQTSGFGYYESLNEATVGGQLRRVFVRKCQL